MKHLLLPLFLLTTVGCSSSSLEGAGKGALGGAAAGAVGGMISAAIFGGDVGNAAARGAAWGASVGAVSGAVQGASADAARTQRAEASERARIEAEIARIRAELGPDAFTSLERLVDGKHEKVDQDQPDVDLLLEPQLERVVRRCSGAAGRLG